MSGPRLVFDNTNSDHQHTRARCSREPKRSLTISLMQLGQIFTALVRCYVLFVEKEGEGAFKIIVAASTIKSFSPSTFWIESHLSSKQVLYSTRLLVLNRFPLHVLKCAR